MKPASFYKIIHTSCHTQWGGIEKRIFNEALWMKAHGHELAFVLPEHTPLFDRLKAQGFRVYPMKFARIRNFSNHRRLVQIFKTELPDIVTAHGNGDTRVGLLAAKRAGIPCRILSRHTSDHVRHSLSNRRLYKKISDYVFTNTESTRQHLQKTFKIPDIEIFSISSAVDGPKELMDKEEARQSLVKELGVEPDTRFIGFAGRISKGKGLFALVKAFGEIAEQVDHHLVFLGEVQPAYLKNLKKKITRLGLEGKIHFPGFREDIWPFYRAIDCTIQPSRKENIPQMLLEAMYSECPVVASNTDGNSDLIEHEQTGLLFEKISDLSQQILLTLNQKSITAERTARARKRILEKYTLDVMGRNIIRIYSLHQVKRRREGLVQTTKIPESWEL